VVSGGSRHHLWSCAVQRTGVRRPVVRGDHDVAAAGRSAQPAARHSAGAPGAWAAIGSRRSRPRRTGSSRGALPRPWPAGSATARRGSAVMPAGQGLGEADRDRADPRGRPMTPPATWSGSGVPRVRRARPRAAPHWSAGRIAGYLARSAGQQRRMARPSSSREATPVAAGSSLLSPRTRHLA
jgi:hypothetical protein